MTDSTILAVFVGSAADNGSSIGFAQFENAVRKRNSAYAGSFTFCHRQCNSARCDFCRKLVAGQIISVASARDVHCIGSSFLRKRKFSAFKRYCAAARHIYGSVAICRKCACICNKRNSGFKRAARNGGKTVSRCGYRAGSRFCQSLSDRCIFSGYVAVAVGHFCLSYRQRQIFA